MSFYYTWLAFSLFETTSLLLPFMCLFSFFHSFTLALFLYHTFCIGISSWLGNSCLKYWIHSKCLCICVCFKPNQKEKLSIYIFLVIFCSMERATKAHLKNEYRERNNVYQPRQLVANSKIINRVASKWQTKREYTMFKIIKRLL